MLSCIRHRECASVVEDKALVFKKSDVDDLREKLQQACDKPKMVKKYKEEAADFICEKYNWEMLWRKRWSCIEVRIWKRNIMVR